MASVSSAGSLANLWRYPVKSMQGEELDCTEVTEQGLAGDRAYALFDQEDGKIVSAKNQRKWPNLFAFRAAYLTAVPYGGGAAPVRITMPDGRVVTSRQPDVNELLSRELGRAVRLRGSERERRALAAARTAQSTVAGPDSESLADNSALTDDGPPVGTYFDLAVVHLLTTATLERLSQLYPEGRFDARRFRPNLVVTTGGPPGFVENGWIGRTLRIGNGVRLQVSAHCSRCVMTTLPQADLGSDPGILRTAAKHNEVSVGVYARVLQGGTVSRGDRLELTSPLRKSGP